MFVAQLEVFKSQQGEDRQIHCVLHISLREFNWKLFNFVFYELEKILCYI